MVATTKIYKFLTDMSFLGYPVFSTFDDIGTKVAMPYRVELIDWLTEHDLEPINLREIKRLPFVDLLHPLYRDDNFLKKSYYYHRASASVPDQRAVVIPHRGLAALFKMTYF